MVTLQTIYEKTPKAERDLPIIIYEGKGYSIIDIIEEVEAGTELGQILRERVLSRYSALEPEIELAKLRLIERFKKTSPGLEYIEIVDGKKVSYTMPELIEEIEAETEFGMSLIRQELRRMEKIKERWR